MYRVDRMSALNLTPSFVSISGNIYGLIFAHPYEDDLPAPVQSDEDKKDAASVFFSCQVSVSYDIVGSILSAFATYRLSPTYAQHWLY